MSRRIAVSANVRGRDLASTVADARAAVEREVPLPMSREGIADLRRVGVRADAPRSIAPQTNGPNATR